MFEGIDCKKIFVYGAGYIAKNVILYLRKIFPELIIDVIISKKVNMHSFEGCNLYAVDDICLLNKESLVIVATSVKYHEEIVNTCKKYGFNNLLVLTPEIEWQFHREYVHKMFPIGSLSSLEIGMDRDFHKLDMEYDDKITIFQVFSGKDKSFDNKNGINVYRESIMAGASLQSEIPQYLSDSFGDNISQKNRQYCELTALYWAWKNCRKDYYGLEHYRRIFEFDEYSMSRVMEEDIDVILPKPTVLYTSLEKHYLECHEICEWEVMREVVNNLYPQYGEVLNEVICSKTFYEYNMIIGKREIMNEYCLWLFPILLQVEEEVGVKCDTYQNRYIGFLAERLLTVFFTENKSRFKIAHANIRMLF